MTETTLPLIELLQKQDDGDFLRSVAEAVPALLMEWSAPWKVVLPEAGF